MLPLGLGAPHAVVPEDIAVVPEALDDGG